MSPLGQRISNWLASAPGLIAGDSLDAMWTGAHFASGLHHAVPLDDFKAALERAGYRPQTRSTFNEKGKPNGQFFVLALPERGVGS